MGLTWLDVTVTAAFGVGLGLLYFGGLWLTVRRLPESRTPSALAFWSFIGRTAAVLAGMYWVTAARWERLLVCMGGFLAVRVIMTRAISPGARRKGG